MDLAGTLTQRQRERAAIEHRALEAISNAYGTFNILLEPDLTAIWASETARTALGDPDLVGRNALDLVHPDDLQFATAAFAYHDEHAQAYATFEKDWHPDQAVVRVRTGSGEWCGFRLSAFNHLLDPAIGGILISGVLAHDQTDLGTIITLLTQGAEVTEVLTAIARMVTTNMARVQAQVLWFDGLDERFELASLQEPHLPELPTALIGELRTMTSPHFSRPVSDFGLAAEKVGYERVWGIPVRDISGSKVQGAVVVWSELSVDFVGGPQCILMQAAQIASLTITDHLAKRQLRWEANHDPLTRLENRTGFARQLDQDHKNCALIYIDLDNFKEVNDEHGHHAGDEALMITADRISQTVRSRDVVARLGGDEFAVLCPGLSSIEIARQVSQRIIAALSQPMTIDGTTVTLGASAGLALGSEREDPNQLFHSADMALIAAKRAGKGQVCLGQPHSHRVLD